MTRLPLNCVLLFSLTIPAGALAPIRDLSSVDLVKEMTTGWNLGNTLDATGGSGTGSETSWGNPKTTPGVMTALKASGFNVVRIPVTWGPHLGPAPTYTIDPAWLDRVNEVVSDALSAGLFVILNLHHEEWHFPSEANFQSARTELVAIWEQIAQKFQNEDEHLIFEGLNEPRMKGTPLEWNGGNAEARSVLNRLNASFVETIRAAGGNNPKRHLMIPTYAASSLPDVLRDFSVPNDKKVIVSVHAYTPYPFALDEKGTREWSVTRRADTDPIDQLMEALKARFLSRGIPVILGEFGARDKGNLASRVAWAEYYIRSAAHRGIPCLVWDNGAFAGKGENFGLLDRQTLTWKFPELVEAIQKGLTK